MGLLVDLGTAAAVGIGYSAGYEVRAFTLREATVPVLPVGSSPIRMLHLSDIHFTPRQRRKAAWLSSLASLQPDCVVVTGDFLAHRDAVPALLSALDGLLDVPGAFVFGSNDYYAPSPKNPVRYLFDDDGTRIHGDPLPTESLRGALEGRGWVDLDNRVGALDVGGSHLALRGVDDPHLERDRYADVSGPWQAGVAIGVAHAPYLRVLDAMAADGARLILAGHTHGGQLRVPGFGALVTNCDLDRARARGLSRHKDAWLHVSAGCGTNPYTPVRFACRPEATLLTLVAGS